MSDVSSPLEQAILNQAQTLRRFAEIFGQLLDAKATDTAALESAKAQIAALIAQQSADRQAILERDTRNADEVNSATAVLESLAARVLAATPAPVEEPPAEEPPVEEPVPEPEV